MPIIIAHRGYSSRFRENSPAAWIGAIRAEADYIEVDLRVTADRKVVCLHDADLVRLAGRSERVRETNSTDLEALAVEGVPLAPRLGLLFETVPTSQPILFDIKDERPEALELYLGALAGAGRDNLVLGLHANASVRQVRRAGWHGKILGFLSPPENEDAFFAEGGDIIRIWESVATAERIGHHVRQGRPVWITTGEHSTGRLVGDHEPGALRRMAAYGATGFLVNDPMGAREALTA